MLFVWCNFYFGIKQWRRSVQERERLSRAETDAREANCGCHHTIHRNESRQGIGIADTVGRLKGLYGASYRFDLQWLDSGDCEVTLELPFREVAKGMESACAH
jgi:hypothetical protein